jgi:1,2-diacylglycerol-3-alpha-glucose alpha-1,2-glucosyltransferase
MKVLLYFQDEKIIKTSGIGRARSHQMRALSLNKVDYVTNPIESFDVAHINTIWSKSKKQLKRCHRLGIPVIVHGHSTHEDFRNSFVLWKFIEPIFDHALDYMYSHADLIITPTEYSKELIDSYGFKVPVVAISNGIDVTEYGNDPEAQEEMRSLYGLKKDEPFVMGVGFPFERKGLIDFIEVARNFPSVKFIWFGHLAAIATSSKIKKAVRHRPDNVIMAGYVKGRLIHGAYQTATCMFFPSYEETEGIVVLEALASHCPLLVRDIGVYKGWLEDGKNAHMGHNNQEFSQEIASLLKNGDSQEILERGYEVAKERNLLKVGSELKATYEKLLADPKFIHQEKHV